MKFQMFFNSLPSAPVRVLRILLAAQPDIDHCKQLRSLVVLRLHLRGLFELTCRLFQLPLLKTRSRVEVISLEEPGVQANSGLELKLGLVVALAERNRKSPRYVRLG